MSRWPAAQHTHNTNWYTNLGVQVCTYCKCTHAALVWFPLPSVVHLSSSPALKCFSCFFGKGKIHPSPRCTKSSALSFQIRKFFLIWFPSGRDPVMASSLAAGPVGHAVILVTEWDARLCEGDPITVTSRGCDMIWVQITELSDRVSIFPSLREPVDSSNEMLKS